MMKNIFRLSGLLLLACSFSFLSTAQTTYYVSPAGNDLGAGTSNDPFKTLTKAISVTINGSNTLIYLRGGTHAFTARVVINTNKSGSAATRLKIYAFPGDPRPVLDFSSMATADGNQGIQIKGFYWHLKGFDVKGAGDNGLILEGGSFNIIENCAFYENDDSGVQIDDGAHDNQIINCDSYFNKDPMDGNADGFAVKLMTGTGNIFKGCRAWNNSDDGWDGLLDDANAGNPVTTLDSCICFRNGYLKNNSASTGNGNGFKMGGNRKLHDMKLTRCLAVYNRVKGFDQNNNDGSMILYNCTGYRNGRNYGMNNNAVRAGEVMELKNCVSFNGVAANTIWSGSTQLNNSWQAPFLAGLSTADFISLDTTGITGPRKADGSLPNSVLMHLAPGSDLIDGGVNVGLPFVHTAPDLGAFETQATLPVKLTSFSAVSGYNGITLQWAIATEVQNKGWMIERSVADQNNTSWTELGFVKGAGNSNVLNKYNYLDPKPAPGSYFYRLKQTDIDGKVSYSNILLVTIGKNGKGAGLAAYPNPFRSSSTVRFNVNVFSQVNLSVYNEAGQFIKTISNEMLEAGTYQKLFSGYGLASGRYILKLQVGSEQFTSSIIKVQ
jgi:hypothetical protein